MWTIESITGGASLEKPFSTIGALAGWGIAMNCPFEFNADTKSAVHLLTTSAFDDAFRFAYNAEIVIRRDRTYADGIFSGGTIWFRGFAAQPGRTVDGARQHHQFTIYNWVSWAERIGFRQPWRFRSGGTYTAPEYVVSYTSEVVLGENLDEGPLDIAAQLTEIFTSLNQRHNPTRWRSYGGAVDASRDLVQIGSIAGAGVPLPRTPATGIMCSEAINTCLKQLPDAILWTDYTTTPPTVNVTALADMPTVTLVLPTNDVTQICRGLHLKPRYDRQLNGVLITYKLPVELDGLTFTGQYVDKFPLTCDVDDPLVMDYQITLGSARVATERTTVKTRVVNAAHLTDATRIAWWQSVDDRLNDDRIVPGSLAIDAASVVVLDENGDEVDLATLPYQLTPEYGVPLAAQNVTTKQVTISANATWKRYHQNADIEIAIERQWLHARLTVCDLNTGGVAENFSAAHTLEAGEVAPTGLAEYLYNAFTTLQHEGTINLVGQEVRGDLRLGMKLTIQTPGGNYASNLIQSISGDITHGAMDVTIGPPGVLGLSDLIEQIRSVRYLQGWKLPSGRSNGGASGAASVTLPNRSARENTIPGHRQPSQHSVCGDYTP